MQKEALTLKNIAEDLKIVSGENMYHKEEAHFTYIVPFTALAVFLGILLQNMLMEAFWILNKKIIFCETFYAPFASNR